MVADGTKRQGTAAVQDARALLWAAGAVVVTVNLQMARGATSATLASSALKKSSQKVTKLGDSIAKAFEGERLRSPFSDRQPVASRFVFSRLSLASLRLGAWALKLYCMVTA